MYGTAHGSEDETSSILTKDRKGFFNMLKVYLLTGPHFEVLPIDNTTVA